MTVLLDTNIIINREAGKGINPDIGNLFYWLDKLKITKCIHPVTVEELNRNKDAENVKTINIKIQNYTILKTLSPFSDSIKKVCDKVDITENDKSDSLILNEVYSERIDLLISEDKKIHTKAKLLNISEKVYKIETFLEKVTAENPDLTDYKVLAVKKLLFGEVELSNTFFDSFREDYIGFDKWFRKKSDEISYVCFQNDILSAFLFVKVEDIDENYSDITPLFQKKRRLKIGTFKVTSNGYKIGERFLKIIFDNALKQKVTEIYVTIFDKRPEQQRLIALLEDWGFNYYGIKNSQSGQEKVYVRNFERTKTPNLENPKLTYPFLSTESDVFIVPIYPEYHTELFPDSILRTESPKDFVENEPHRNALSKVYICRSREKNLHSGDLIVFYRTGGYYEGVVTTIGVVESVVTQINDESQFIALCRKRSVFTDDELKKHWNYRTWDRPFIVNFLYIGSLLKKPNLKWLIENGIVQSIENVPRGFYKISREQFNKIIDQSRKK